MFQLNRVNFFIQLYLNQLQHHGAFPGSLSNVHQLYDKCPDPYFWIHNYMLQRSKSKAAFKISNSKDIVVSNNTVTASTLVETDGTVDGITLDSNTINSFGDATVLHSSGILNNSTINNNQLRQLDIEKNMSEAKIIKAAGKIEDVEVTRNVIEGFEKVTLLESGDDVINAKVIDNKILHLEAQKLLLKLQGTADDLELEDSTRTELNHHISSMNSTVGSGSFIETYKDFSNFLSTHVTIMTPLLPLFTQLGQYLSM